MLLIMEFASKNNQNPSNSRFAMKPLYYQLCLATGIAVLLFPSLAARGAFFTTNTTIGVGNTNYDGQDIVVYDCTDAETF